jgi:hypothetical protein
MGWVWPTAGRPREATPATRDVGAAPRPAVRGGCARLVVGASWGRSAMGRKGGGWQQGTAAKGEKESRHGHARRGVCAGRGWYGSGGTRCSDVAERGWAAVGARQRSREERGWERADLCTPEKEGARPARGSRGPAAAGRGRREGAGDRRRLRRGEGAGDRRRLRRGRRAWNRRCWAGGRRRQGEVPGGWERT